MAPHCAVLNLSKQVGDKARGKADRKRLPRENDQRHLPLPTPRSVICFTRATMIERGTA